MDVEGFSPLGMDFSSSVYNPDTVTRPKIKKNESLTASTPSLPYKNGIPTKSTSTLTSSRSSIKSTSSSFRRDTSPPERKIKETIYSTDGEYKLQRYHKLGAIGDLKTSFSPIHQAPSRCSIIPTPKNYSDIIFEVQTEKIIDDTFDCNFLLAYNTKDAVFLDKYIHQYNNQCYTINPRPSDIPLDLKKAKNTDRKCLTITKWPHHIRCKRVPSAHLFFNSDTIESSKESKFLFIIGFTTGEIVVYEPWNTDIAYPTNKVSNAAVMCLTWLPGKEGKILVCGYSDGTICFINIKLQAATSFPSSSKMVEHCKSEIIITIWKNNEELNPIVKWGLCKGPIYDIKFSDNGDYIAIGCGDGFIRLIDMHKGYHNPKPFNINQPNHSGKITHSKMEIGKCIASLQSYFGAILCLSWSHDGLFIASGGEDDFVSIWSFKSLKLIARGSGHRSWVSDISFDKWRCIEGDYRIGSVGQDGRMLLWDFNVVSQPNRRRRNSSLIFSKRQRCNSPSDSLSMDENIKDEQLDIDGLIVYSPGKNDVPIIEPEADHRVHNVPVGSIYFTPYSIITTGNEPCIRIWSRPNCYIPRQSEVINDIPEAEDIGKYLEDKL